MSMGGKPSEEDDYTKGRRLHNQEPEPDYEETLEFFLRAAEKNPEDGRPRFMAGHCLFRKGEFNLAIAKYVDALSKTNLDDDERARTLSGLAACHRNKQEYIKVSLILLY